MMKRKFVRFHDDSTDLERTHDEPRKNKEDSRYPAVFVLYSSFFVHAFLTKEDAERWLAREEVCPLSYHVRWLKRV